MASKCILEIRHVRKVDVIPGPIWEGLNQDNILSHFQYWYPVEPRVVSALYLRAFEDPIILETEKERFVEIVNAETAEIFANQTCLQLGGKVDIQAFLPKEGNSIPAVDLAHIVGHILLPYVQRCRDPWINGFNGTFDFQEITYPNQFNPMESIICFNFPTKVADLGKFAEIVLFYLDLWVTGEATHQFKIKMQQQDEINTTMLSNP